MTAGAAPSACPDWLALRRGADTRARDAGAGDLLARLVDHLGAGTGDAPLADVVSVVDVGAGTGANHAYLAPRLPFRQRWLAVDHDPELLAHPGHDAAEQVVADVEHLASVLPPALARRGRTDPGGSRARTDPDGSTARTLITCSALLDVLTRDQLRGLAGAVAAAGGPALLALTVTGGVGWWPAEPEDEQLQEAFDAHQRREGRAGPEAVALLTELLEAEGLRVLRARTPWELDAADRDDRALLARWLEERVEAAGEQVPALAAAGLGWRERRRAQLASGTLRVRVDHVDLLVLPAGSAAPAAG